MKRSAHISRVLFATILALPCGMPDTAAAQPGFGYSSTAAEPVIEYNLVHHMLAKPDPLPLLRIYGDGRVRVHYPDYMTLAGDYEMRLDQQQLQGLLRDLSAGGIIDFNRSAVMQRRRQSAALQRARTGILFDISDSSDTVVVVRLDSYQRHPGSSPVVGLERRFSWPDLEQDARRFPGLVELTNARNAVRKLEELLQSNELARKQ